MLANLLFWLLLVCHLKIFTKNPHLLHYYRYHHSRHCSNLRNQDNDATCIIIQTKIYCFIYVRYLSILFRIYVRHAWSRNRTRPRIMQYACLQEKRQQPLATATTHGATSTSTAQADQRGNVRRRSSKRWPFNTTAVCCSVQSSVQNSGAVWNSRWPSWAPVRNKPTVSVDVKQHFNQPTTEYSSLRRLCVDWHAQKGQ